MAPSLLWDIRMDDVPRDDAEDQGKGPAATEDSLQPDAELENLSHSEERKREEHGNRGPEEVPGFGQGA